MTEFDARISARNGRSNRILDNLVKDMKRNGLTRAEINMVDRVIRPFAHIMNECEVKEVDITNVNEATVSTVVTMFTELAARTVPKGSPTAVHQFVNDVLEDFQTSFLKAMAVNFDVTFEVAQPAEDSTPPAQLHS